MANRFLQRDDDEKELSASQRAKKRLENRFFAMEDSVATRRLTQDIEPEQPQRQEDDRQSVFSRLREGVSNIFRPRERQETDSVSANLNLTRNRSSNLGKISVDSGITLDDQGRIVRPNQDELAPVKDVVSAVAPVYVEQQYQDQLSRLSELNQNENLSSLESISRRGLEKNVAELERLRNTPVSDYTQKDKSFLLALQSGRGARAAATTTVSLGQSLLGFMAQASEGLGFDETADAILEREDAIDRWRQAAIDFREPDIVDEIAMGVSSTGSFLVAGGVVAGGARAMAMISPRAAMLFGGSVSAVLEASAESGAVYTQNIDSGMDEKEALRKANNTFALNMVLNQITNQFGFFGTQVSALKRMLSSAGAESIQEASQQIISNVNTNQPPLEGVAMSAILGGLIGGGLSVFTGEINSPDKLPEPEIQTADDNPVTQAIERMGESEQGVDQQPPSTQDQDNTDVVEQFRQEGVELTRTSPDVSSENEIFHGGKSDIETVRRRGVIGSKNGIRGDAVYFGGISIAQDFGGTNAYSVDKSKFNLKRFDTLQDEINFIKEQGFEDGNINDLSAAIRKAGFDGFEIPNPDPNVGTSWGITNLDKLNSVIRGEEVATQQQEQDTQETTQEARPVRATSKSVREQNQTVKIDGDTVTVTNRDGRKVVGRFNFTLDQWRDAQRQSGNENFAQKQFIRQLNQEATPENYQGEAVDPMVNRIEDSQISAINEAISQLEQQQVDVVPQEAPDPVEPMAEPVVEQSAQEDDQAQQEEARERERLQKQIDNIEEYIDSKGVKLRQGDVVAGNETVTTKLLQSDVLEGREVVSVQFLRDTVKSKKLNLSGKERLLVESVLDKDFQGQKKISVSDFREAVLKELLPLNTIVSDTYATYGSDSVLLTDSQKKTYILDSPFKHGYGGHFHSDYKANFRPDELEVKEIPVSDQNPTVKWAVMVKDVALTRENIADNVLNVSTTREGAQQWIESHTYQDSVQIDNKSGLFGHFRSFDTDESSHIVEIQSDAFQNIDQVEPNRDLRRRIRVAQHEVSTTEKRLSAAIQSLSENADSPEAASRWQAIVENYRNSLLDRRKGLEDLQNQLAQQPVTQEAQQFMEYKNQWLKRMVREAISIKANEGAQKIRFATPRTVAFVEGFAGEGDFMPYDIVEASDENRLEVGDVVIIDNTRLVVVEADMSSITVAEESEVTEFLDSDYREEQAEYFYNEAVDQIESIELLFDTKIDSEQKVEAVKALADLTEKFRDYNQKESVISRLTKPKNDLEETIKTLGLSKKDLADKYDKSLSLIEKGILKQPPDSDLEYSRWLRELGHVIEYKDEPSRVISQSIFQYDVATGTPLNIDQGVVQDWIVKNLSIRKDQGLQTIEDSIEEKKSELEKVENRIQEVRELQPPTDQELEQLLPLADAEKIRSIFSDITNAYYLDFMTEQALDYMVEQDNYSLDDIREDYIYNQSVDYEPDYEGMYAQVFYQRNGYDTKVYGVNGHTERFMQPDDYIQRSDIDFDIEHFSGEQRTVLDFYDKQVIPYLQKLRKNNITLVEDSEGFTWWETQVTPEDKLPPTAYRIKEDLLKAGIEITDQQEAEILKLNQEVFGDSSVKVVSQILANQSALGSYSENLIKILDKQVDPKDTFYHEAVHKYLDVFTERSEHIEILRQAQDMYQLDNLYDVEERLAEDFIKYAKSRESVAGKLRVFFDRFMGRLKAYFGNQDAIEKLYSDIISGQARRRSSTVKRQSSARVAVAGAEIKYGASDVEDYLRSRYSKTLEDATKSQLVKAIATSKAVLLGDESQQLNDGLGSASKAHHYKSLVKDTTIFYQRTKNLISKEGVYTDGYFMVHEPKVANKMRDQVVEFATKRFEDQFFKEGNLTKSEARAKAEREIRNTLKEGSFPDSESKTIIDNGQEATQRLYFQGIQGGEDKLMSIFTNGDTSFAINTNYVALFRSEFGKDVEFFTNGSTKSPIYARVAGKQVGMIMPIATQDTLRIPTSYNYPLTSKPDTESDSPSGVYASRDEFREDIPIEMGQMKEVAPIQIPEMVQLAKELLDGKYPTSKRNMGNKLGYFSPSVLSPEIVLKSSLFREKNQRQLASTLAHEIGHLIDYVPDRNMGRGNIIGRIHSLNNFLRQTFTDANTEAEITQLTLERKNLTEQRRDTQKGSAENKRLYKEIVRLNKKIKKMRSKSTLDGRKVYSELWELSKWWKPINEQNVSPNHLKYRKSSAEVYADAISVLFNSPGQLEKRAPTFYNAFFEALDNKPKVKKEYFEIQALYDGGSEAALEARKENIQQMFAKGKEVRNQMEREKRLKNVRVWERARQDFDDINHPILKKINQAEAKGAVIAPENNPRYLLEELALTDNEVYQMMAEVTNKVNKPLVENDLSDDTLGEFLFLKRIVGRPDSDIESQLGIPQGTLEKIDDLDSVKEALLETGNWSEKDLERIEDLIAQLRDRREIANPLGFAKDTAQAQLDFLKDSMSQKQWDALNQAGENFHEIVFSVVQQAVEVGSYNKETFETLIKPNKGYYASFGVLNYLQEFVPATVKKQAGTLSEVENPFVTTILKTVALQKLNAKQRAANSTRDFLIEQFPSEISKAQKTKYGFRNPKKDMGHLYMLEDGKLVAYEVDEYIAQSFERNNYGNMNLAIDILRGLNNSVFRPMFITYNPGFLLAFNPIRDFKRLYKNFPDVSARKIFTEYFKAIKPSIKRQMGINDELISEMLENKAFGVEMDTFLTYMSQDTAVDRILKRYKLGSEKKTTREKLISGLTIPLSAMRFAGGVLESMPKVAAYNALVQKSENKKEIAYRVRNYAGTPNFRRGGKYTNTTNVIFMFSNIAKEGWKSDIQVATNPKTASGFWFRTAQVSLAPKALMIMAAAGLFGDELEELFEKIPDYDKTNYLVIPYGVDKNGKAIYFRMPQDETGRFLSGMMWKIASANLGARPTASDLTDLFGYSADVLPGLAPPISLGADWFQFLQGQNPYDEWRGRPIIDETTWQAGGYPALKKMLEHTWNEVGLGSWYQFTTYDSSTDSTTETFIRGLPVINRLLKVSDYGLRESTQDELKRIEAQQAADRLDRREVTKEYADAINEGKKKFNESTLRQLAGELFEDEKPSKQQLSALRKQLGQYTLRAQNDPLVSSAIYARSSDERLKVIEKMAEVRGVDETKSNLKKMLDFKVISSNFYFDALRKVQ